MIMFKLIIGKIIIKIGFKLRLKVRMNESVYKINR